MSSAMTSRLKVSKSRIPRPVKKPTSLIVNDCKRKVPEKPLIEGHSTSAKLLKSDPLKKQSNPEVVKPLKKTENDKFNVRFSTTSNKVCSNLNKNAKPLQLKNIVKLESSERKIIDKHNSDKEKVLKSKDNLLKSKITNNTTKRIALFKTNVQPGKNTTAKLGVAPIDSSNNHAFEKENKASSMPSWFDAQKDIKFEVNPNSKKIILRDHAPSPSIGNKLSGFRLSMQSQRPSIYQPMELSADPHADAMKAIANFSAKRKKEILLQDKPLKLLSPFKDRNSLYTPCADPGQEVMESLRKLKLKQKERLQLIGSTKKVTFNLNVREYSPKDNCDEEPKLFQESKLSLIDEKSEENTPSSPKIKTAEVPSTDQNKVNAEIADFKENRESQDIKTVAETESSNCQKFVKSTPFRTATSIKYDELSSVQCKDTASQMSKKIVSPPVPGQILKNESISDEISIKRERTNIGKVPSEKDNQTTVYTPKPISLYSKSMLRDSCSPEFLTKRNSKLLLKEAPIRTPLVLKSMAKDSELSPDVENDLSPVRLKLNFAEKETPREKILKFRSSLSSKEIKTARSRLDDLADRECYECLVEESIPVVCGRYITNPVARILAEGDEMHFIPIKL